MSWLTRSFGADTPLGLVISAAIGGVIGALVTFLFQDLLSPWLSFRRESGRLLRKYTTPLLRSADRLQSRINILIRNADKGWYEGNEYFRMSTLYIFAEYAGWVRNIEREFGFVPMESARQGRAFNRRFNGFFGAITGFSYFRSSSDTAAVDKSAVPRLIWTAIGELVTDVNEHTQVMGFTEFDRKYREDAEFRRWFVELDAHLGSTQRSNLYWWDRLIAAQANLLALCALLDPRGRMVRRQMMSNLALLNNDTVRTKLLTDFADLAPRHSTAADPATAL